MLRPDAQAIRVLCRSTITCDRSAQRQGLVCVTLVDNRGDCRRWSWRRFHSLVQIEVMSSFSIPYRSSKASPSVTRRARFESASVVSETVFREPGAELKGIVLGEFQGWREWSNVEVRRREAPHCIAPLIINFGSLFGIVDLENVQAEPRRVDTFLAGLHRSYSIVESSGHSCCIQVNFTPLGARRFFQVPMSSLSDSVVNLDDVFGDRAKRLVEALAELDDWDQRFDMLETLILQRIRSAKPPRGEVAWAFAELERSYGVVEIGELASEIGWSHKHLIAQFRDQIGQAPKLLARVLRFQRTIELLSKIPEPRWVDVACACGYFDQSHMIREFRELAGCTPHEYLGLQLPFGGISV